jgi:hypothetical protein
MKEHADYIEMPDGSAYKPPRKPLLRALLERLRRIWRRHGR